LVNKIGHVFVALEIKFSIFSSSQKINIVQLKKNNFYIVVRIFEVVQEGYLGYCLL
jgi:hypothetical protein